MGDRVTKNRHLLRQLIENIDDNIFFKDRAHNFILINEANARWFGFGDPSEAIGKNDFDLFDAEFAQKAFDDEERIMATGKAMKGEVETTVHNGEIAWGSVTKVPIRDDAGEICGIMGIGRDVTALKERESELEEAHEQMAQDLRVAASLQQAFLPNRYPTMGDGTSPSKIQFHHYYAACDQLGGDFCSIHQLSDTKAGLLICDVMGHGVRSALVTASIKAISSELSRTQLTAAEFLSKMNRRLHALLQDADTLIFATACYVIIDVESGNLQLAAAGHPLPIHLHAEDGLAEFVCIPAEARGPALALQSDFTYESCDIQFNPGDSLLLYTDGLVEATSAEDQEFGADNLLDAVSSDKSCALEILMQSLVGCLKEFRGHDRLEDDICLLGFKLDESS
jgi:sigma-B regulation protein RsbU (phosphoserine phosphatase)